jgi:hypothetical protein
MTKPVIVEACVFLRKFFLPFLLWSALFALFSSQLSITRLGKEKQQDSQLFKWKVKNLEDKVDSLQKR